MRPTTVTMSGTSASEQQPSEASTGSTLPTVGGAFLTMKPLKAFYGPDFVGMDDDKLSTELQGSSSLIWSFETYHQIRSLAKMFEDPVTQLLTPEGLAFFVKHRDKFPILAKLSDMEKSISSLKGEKYLEKKKEGKRWIRFCYQRITWWDMQPPVEAAQESAQPGASKRKREDSEGSEAANDVLNN